MRPNNKTWWETAFPAVTWLRNYHRGWFRLDLLAGITLAAYLLLAADFDLCHFRNFARDRRVAWRDYRWEHVAVCRARGGHGVARVAYRLHCLAGQGGSHGAFHLRECHDRLQIRRGTFSCQHTIAKALRFSRRAWKLLGKHGLFLKHLNETNSMSILVGGI